jgi:hypothetical protein
MVDVEEGILGFRYVEWLPSKIRIHTHQDYIVGRECDLAIGGFKLAQIEYICKAHLLKKIGNQTPSMTSETLIKECSGHRMMIGADSR